MENLFEKSVPGRRGVTVAPLPPGLVPPELPEARRRRTPPRLPEVSELQVLRHYVALSQRTYSMASGPYPLGSCTMKYNPVVNDRIAALPGFSRLHPDQPEETVQGALEVMVELAECLAEITGMPEFTLQPAAGAHGELTGMLIVRAYHRRMGQHQRDEVLVPDSAHGTNPATAAMAGFKVVSVPSDARGGVDRSALDRLCGDRTAGLMLTNPNTLGVFDEGIVEIARLVHARGGLVYYDGANLNAVMGRVRPGDMGFDLCHVNLHKTFSTPHGGGGPGAGPVGVRADLARFLPGPRPVRRGSGFAWEEAGPDSIGPVRAYFGNFLVLVRALAYIRALGAEGLRQTSEDAVVAANYLASQLGPDLPLAYDRIPKHEFVVSAARLRRETGVRALDLAKGLIDQGVHPPTVYFPLTVEEALMVEPTESEAKEDLDRLAAAFREVVRLAREDPETLRTAPHTAPVGRLDEARATRQPDLRHRPGESLPPRAVPEVGG